MSEIKQGYKQTKVGIIPEDWEVVKLESISDFITKGATPTTYGFNWQEDGIPFLRSECVSDNGLNLKAAMYICQDAHSVMKRSSISSGDILMTITGNVGRVILLDNFQEGNINQHVARIRIIEEIANKNFIFSFLSQSTYQLNYSKITTGQAYPQLSLVQVRDSLVPLPPLKEQEKIAQILTTWDEAITKQTELLEAKELQKKALMQKLLSGEVRFSGFSDEWEEVRLGEIGEFKTSSIDKIINENEKLVNLINYMDVYRNKHIDKNFRCSKTSLKEEQYEKVNLKKGDILFTPSSETPDDIGHSAVIIEDLPNTVYSYHLVRFSPKKSIDLKFSGYVFNNIDILKEFAKRANGSTRFTLSIKDFNETKAKLPSLLEQHKIAEVLRLADDEINLLKNELEELKLQKKALMQKLLTGQVRVKV